jgi:phage terminase large subunit-like protein
VNNDPDWTRGVRLDVLRDGRVVISDVVSLRDRPGQVNKLMDSTVRLDGPKVTQAMWINPGDSGQFERDALDAQLRKVPGCGPLVFLKQTLNKEGYARPCAAFFDPELRGVQLGAIVRASWNGECLAEAELFPLNKHPVTGEDLHDDFVDALSRAFVEVDQRSRRGGRLLDWANADVSRIDDVARLLR